MKKSILLSTMAVTLFVPSVLFGASEANAAQVASLGSNVDVTFAQDTSVTSPVNPTDPTQPVSANPADPHQVGTPGPLSIDYVSNFHFGSQQIKAGNAVYYANLDQVVNSQSNLISVPNYVQVTDKRGLNLGWKLSVKQNGQLQTSDATPAVLTNASVSMLAATPNSTMLLSLAPITAPVVLDPSGTNASVVATSAVSTGMGTWTMAFGSGATASTGVQLSVPAATTKVSGKQYHTTLTWTLNDSPL